MMDFKKVFLGLGAVTLAGAAFATPTYVAPVGADGSGTGLQDMLNSRTQDGVFDQDVTTDQFQPDEKWTVDAVARSNIVMMFEIAGNANSNTMGIYDLNNTSNRLELFGGPASNGFSSRLAINSSGDFVVTQFDQDDLVLGQQVGNFSSYEFGFYLDSPSYSFYSQTGLNGDYNTDGVNDDHMVAYQGDSSDKIDTAGNGLFYGDFTSNNFILAWEDLRFDDSTVDYDYNDMVVMIESFIPVPEPATLALLGLGLAGLGAARRRKA